MLRRLCWCVPVLALLCACKQSDEAALPTRMMLYETMPAQAQAQVALLNFWEPVSGVLQPGERHVWQFAGQAGDNIAVRAVGQGVALILTLQTADGRTLAQGGSIEGPLAEGGVFTVIVQLAPGSPGGAYDLGLSYTDRRNPTELAATPLPEVVGVPTPVPPFEGRGTFISRLSHNNTAGGTLSEVDQNHVYTFDGLAEQFVQIEVLRVSGTIDPRVTLFDPVGIPLAMDDNSAGNRGALLRNVRLPQDGLYSVQASGGGFFGAYTIRLLIYEEFAPVTPTFAPSATFTPTLDPATPTLAAAIPGNRLEDHAPVIAAFNRPGDVNIYPIYVAQGEIITIGVSPAQDSQVRPRIEVVDPEGQVVASAAASTSNANGDALISPLRAELEGVYQVFVTAEDDVLGAYVISYGRGSTRLNVMRGLVEADTAVQGQIARRGVRDVWALPLSAGDIISAAVSPDGGSQLDPLLELVPAGDPNSIVAIDDNSGGDRNPLLSNIRVPTTGMYYLRVKASQAASTGPYTLIWRYVNRAPTATVPPAVAPILTINDAVAASAYNFYPFQGRAGQMIQVRVTASPNSEFDPVAALLDPFGQVLVEVDDVNGDLNPVFLFLLTVDGTYNIRVNGYLSGGPFEVVVEEVF